MKGEPTMTDDRHEFLAAAVKEIATQGRDEVVQAATHEWLLATYPHNYSYHFRWLGLPIIQYPMDIVATQELIWEIRPDLIIETGIARGGSLILSASLLALLELTDARETGTALDPRTPTRKVLGIDIDIRDHNRQAVETHPLADRIVMIEGSSIDPAVVDRVTDIAAQHSRVMVMLDSNHTHDHVLAELEAYGPLVSPGSYCVVFDTLVEDLPGQLFPNRPWGPGNNPKTAVRQFLAEHPEFTADTAIDDKLLITVAREGFLKRAVEP